MLPLIFQKRLFLYLFAGFILAVVAGVMSHEFGHWIAARYLGFSGQHLAYNYTNYGTPDDHWRQRDSLLVQYHKEMTSTAGHPAKDDYLKLVSARERDRFLLTAGGPLQTMLAGTLGVILLLVYRRKFAVANELSFPQWLIVFLSLFWLREVFDVVVAIIRKGAGHAWMEGDEFRMARALEWPTWSIFAITSVISLLVLWRVVFRYVPAKQRLTFLVAGFTGGLTGAYLWLVLLGPKLMP